MKKGKQKSGSGGSRSKKPFKYDIEDNWLAGYIKENMIRSRGEAEDFIRSYISDNSCSRKEVVQLLNRAGIYLSKLPL